MCLWDRTYYKMSCNISGKEFNVSNAGFDCHSLRLNDIVKEVLAFITYCGSTDQ